MVSPIPSPRRRQIASGIKTPTRDALPSKALRGYVTGGSVFGYRNVEIVGDGARRHHVGREVDPAQAEIVRRMFTLAAEGLGFKRIAARLWGPEEVPGPPGEFAPKIDGTARSHEFRGHGTLSGLFAGSVTSDKLVTRAGSARFRLTVPLETVYRRVA